VEPWSNMTGVFIRRDTGEVAIHRGRDQKDSFSQGKGCQGSWATAGTAKRQRRIVSHKFQGEPGPADSWISASGLQRYEGVYFCCLSHLVRGPPSHPMSANRGSERK
jgi:hypothetical protein